MLQQTWNLGDEEANLRHYPILPWPGGKRRLTNKLLPMIDGKPHDCYVEEFSGGGAMFFRKKPCHAEVINDINGDLINLYRVIKNHLGEFTRQFEFALISRELFELAKGTPPETLTDIQRAARFYYIQRTAFGGKVSSQSFGYSPSTPPKFNISRLEDDLKQAHQRLSRAWIEHLDWQTCLHKYDRDYTLHFMDPPYYGLTGYGTAFPVEEYEKLAEAMRVMKGSAILTINYHPDMVKVFKEFTVEIVDIRYSIGGG